MKGERRAAVVEVRVERLGGAGDGVAFWQGEPVYLPRSLPGEQWRVRLVERRQGAWRADALELLEGPARAEPVCPHFGRCGGCLLQHVPDDAYRGFKLARITEALERAGVMAEQIMEPVISPPASRRRLRLAFALAGGKALLGFKERRSHRVVPLDVCPIASPALTAVFAPLAACLGHLGCACRGGEASLSQADNGVDLLLHLSTEPDLADRERLASLAEAADLARLAIAIGNAAPEPVVVCRTPVVRFGNVPVELPPGAFLQATRAGEAALQAAVAGWVPEGARLVDLFAGLGTLSLPLASRLGPSLALDADPAATTALTRAASRTGLARYRVQRRDLAREPVSAGELRRFDVAVLDPPHAGALAQARELALARVPTVAYVSCHPGSFARDAAVLQGAGYRLREVRPVDQFLFSATVELAALLTTTPPSS